MIERMGGDKNQPRAARLSLGFTSVGMRFFLQCTEPLIVEMFVFWVRRLLAHRHAARGGDNGSDVHASNRGEPSLLQHGNSRCPLTR